MESESVETERVETEAVFGAPWEAQVFALVLTLQHCGLFTWAEWSEALASVVNPAEGAAGNPVPQTDLPNTPNTPNTPDMTDSHYGHWLAALEKMVVSKGVGDVEELSTLYQSWDNAARATPHGQPIELNN